MSKHKVTLVDTATNQVLSTFDAGAESPLRLRFTPDGKRAVMTFGKTTKAGVFDVVTRSALRWIDIDSGSKVLTISPDGCKAAASVPHNCAVLILDLVNGKLVGKIEVSGKPDGVAWAGKQAKRRR